VSQNIKPSYPTRHTSDLHYGPTETTVGVLAYEVTDADSCSQDRSATVPLGKPIAAARVYVLDSRGELVPPWVSGEIYIGGPGVRSEEHTSELQLRENIVL